MLRTLFVTEKWANCDPKLGLPTSARHILFRTYESANVGSYANFFLEEHLRDPSDELLRFCDSVHFDLIVATIFPNNYQRMNPAPEAFAKLRNRGIPVALIWWDARSPKYSTLCQIYDGCATTHVILDYASFPHTSQSKRIPLWTPVDPRLFHDAGEHRDLDIVFAGSIYANRAEYLDSLIESGLRVYVGRGQRVDQMSIEEYVHFHQRSKIILNFSQTWDGHYQNKGRLWEAMATGACVFEQDNPETRRWFSPWKDYVPFSNKYELEYLARRLLGDDSLRLQIAEHGKQTVQHKYSAVQWWEKVTDRCGLTNRWRGATPTPLPGLSSAGPRSVR